MNWRRGGSCVLFWVGVVGMCALERTGNSPVRAAMKTPAGSTEAGLDFAREIQPILSDNCFACHGPDAGKRKADLRFDTLDPKQGPFAPRDGYAIVAPGDLENSVLIMRITSDDADVHMPPAASHRQLTARQIELIKKWVQQGAKWE